ncbi:MAG TPA: U32 family peptidase [Halothiobacillus sp.]|nr:U32 family peptidase [Halothiobacillus sp.]
MHNHQLELLSPARDADIGIEAINHGADAVYIGGPGFGARKSADNSVADIARLVAYAHRFHTRIFVTLNTILRDDELEPARKLIRQMADAGVDALIIQDMGLLELDLPDIELHASTQCDIRTPEKARFLQDVGFSQLVLARELDLNQIRAVRAMTDVPLEFFVHGALCVAYSGQCFISEAHTGRSANRGECNQACRLPYQVADAAGGVIAHDKHVLSLKDNNQSANIAALVDAGIRSFKIEGRYKDMGYVKNITAHYRQLLDEVLEQRSDLSTASSGKSTFLFTPNPEQNFNRAASDYFVQGRKEDIGAFDSPKNPGIAIGHVAKILNDSVELESTATLNNGDGLCYFDLHNELVGMAINTAEKLSEHRWRVVPKDPIGELRHLRVGTALNRNRDMNWQRLMDKKSAERRIMLSMLLDETPDGLTLTLIDEDNLAATIHMPVDKLVPNDGARSDASLRENLSKLGTTIFHLDELTLNLSQPWFVPASRLNALRREAVEALEVVRQAALSPLPRAAAIEPPVAYPQDSLSYLANVFNQKAHDFYAKHGVKLIEAAFESHEEEGEVSLMITKHCVRYSLSLCPKQTKGVTGVHGTIKAEPLMLINGSEKLKLVFDCKPCEMHVVGKMKRSVAQQRAREVHTSPITFYQARPS